MDGRPQGIAPTGNAADVFSLPITHYELSGVLIIHGRPQGIAPTGNATGVFSPPITHNALRITHYI